MYHGQWSLVWSYVLASYHELYVCSQNVFLNLACNNLNDFIPTECIEGEIKYEDFAEP